VQNRTLIYPFFIPNLGCPGNCIFCDQHKISGAKEPNIDDIKAEAESFVQRNQDKKKEIAFYGGSFTALPREKQREYLQAVIQIDGDFDIRISTHPLFINKDILDFLRENRVQTIELGVQDFCDIPLKESGRGYTNKDAVNASNLIKKEGFSLGIQLMPGLPGSDEKSLNENLLQLEKVAPDCLRIYPTIVIRGTALEELYLRGAYKVLTLSQAVQICVHYHDLCEKCGIKLIKMGLSSNLHREDVVAGPFHPAFGELVKQELLIRQLKKEPSKIECLTRDQKGLLKAHGCDYLNRIGYLDTKKRPKEA
jgi:histone acetyltransferase (RNA polymerase elongator complex component)